MRRSPSAALRSSATWVVAATFALAVVSIAVVVTLQGRANASRDAQVALAEVAREFVDLQSAPYDAVGADLPTQAGVLREMERAEGRIEARLVKLTGASPTTHLREALPYFRANTATLERIWGLLVAGRQAESDALGPVAGLQEAAVTHQLGRAGSEYRRRASRSLRLATTGSAATILLLGSLFAYFYLRSRTAHARAEGLARENARLLVEDSQLQVIQRLALAGEYRDDDTGQHTARVAEMSVWIGAELGMSADELALLGQAAPLHDVGKIGIPDRILLKPSGLTRAEFDHMKTHTTVGAQMLARPGFPLLELAEQVALTHHERWDGSGYPAGLAGEAIPLAGRIVAVADVFDALTHERPYKSAWTVAEAVAEIRTQIGRQFDPEVVAAFLAVVPAVSPADDPTPAEVRRPSPGRAARV
jgi:HD-GYP domain-containing protein (c-di-GMP phosphodiesterase class II)